MSNDVTPGAEKRPDGRDASDETVALRVATRALRDHLDQLPIDYTTDTYPDRFLGGLAFMFARQRFDCADSMIGSGFGGTVIGSLGRSLLVDGLRWLWIAEEPRRLRSLLGDLLMERSRLSKLLDRADASCPIFARWLMPLPAIADLTGASLAWLDATESPSDDELLEDFINSSPGAGQPGASQDGSDSDLLGRTRTLMSMAGLHGISMVLAHAGHGNYLGLQSTLAAESAPGYDLRADHEALFMQAAAFGVTATLLGSAAAVPELWPKEVPGASYIEQAVELASAVSVAASRIHGLTAKIRGSAKSRKVQAGVPQLIHPGAVLSDADLLPDVNSISGVVAAAEEYYEAARSFVPDIWGRSTSSSLHNVLSLGGGHSHLDAVMATYDQPGSEVIAVFAARMLLEESARLMWRYSANSEEFESRATQYFDEYRARTKRTMGLMVGAGLPVPAVSRLFDAPPNVTFLTPPDQPSKGRTPIPTIGAMLRDLGAPFPEPGWLELAYSLLSQVVHSTPLGHLHAVRYSGGLWRGNEMSPEMLGLAIDVACFGSAHLIGVASVVATELTEEAIAFRGLLLRKAMGVHDRARLVHGLD